MARDLVLELHPHGGIGKTFNIHCHGYDKGASGRKVSDIGFEIDVTSEFSTPLAELKELGVRTLELSCRSIEKEDEPIGEKLQRPDAFQLQFQYLCRGAMFCKKSLC